MSSYNHKKLRNKHKLDYTKHVLVVSRSNKNISVQVLEPSTKKTLATFNSNTIKGITKTEKSIKVGENLAGFLKSNKINDILFDRNGLVFRGRVKQLADSLTSQGFKI